METDEITIPVSVDVEVEVEVTVKVEAEALEELDDPVELDDRELLLLEANEDN